MPNKISIQGLHSLQAFSPPLICGCIFKKKSKGLARQRNTVRQWKDVDVVDKGRLGSLRGITPSLHTSIK